jgi:hypothetical protein
MPYLAGAPAADPRCPLPSARGVPDSLRGALVGAFAPDAKVTVGGEATGRIDVTGSVKVRGSYTELDFNDQAVHRSGTVSVPVVAGAYATPPLRLTWQAQS